MTAAGKLALALVIAAVSAAGTWRVQEWRYAAKERDRLEAEAEGRRINSKAASAAAGGYEQKREQAARASAANDRSIDRVVQDPRYADLCFDADGLRILAAESAGTAAREPGAGLP